MIPKLRPRWRGTAYCIAAALVVACTVAVAGTPSAAQTARMLTVSPDTGLVDGDVVALHGTGFTPSSTVYFCQGVEDGAPGPEDCGVQFQSVQADAAGEFDASYTVRRYMAPPTVGATIDCAEPSAGCVLGASDIGASSSGVARVTLAFAPQPPRTLTVTPDTDLVDGVVVELHGSGFTPGDTVDFCQAVEAGLPGREDCGAPTESAQADAAGELAASYTVRRFISISSPAMTDCAAPSASCALDFFSFGGLASDRVPITFSAQPPVPQLSGTVTDPQGAPVVGVAVWAYTPSDTWVGSLQTVTDAEGSYQFAEVEPGVQYRIRFGTAAGLASEWFEDAPTRQSAYALVLSAAEFVEANAQLDEGGAITGDVTDGNGNPASGVQVTVFGFSDTWAGSYQTSTADDGSYSIGNVRAGSYRVLFVPPVGPDLASEWFDDTGNRKLSTSITVPLGETVAGIDAQLEETGAIAGSVTDTNGNPVSGVEVWAFDPGDAFVGFDRASTASDGTYEIGNLRSENYRVVFRPPTGSGLGVEWFDDAAKRSLATDVTLLLGQTVVGIDAQLANSP